jgi:galactokinase
MYMERVYQRGAMTSTSTAKERALDAFRRRFRRDPEILVRAPGRVNLIGEHVDYNGGLVLPVAIDRSAWLAAARSEESVTTLEAVDVGATIRFTADRLAAKTDAGGAPLPTWACYPAAVAWVLEEHGLAVAAVNAALASDVPIGAGLSSSAAIEVAFARMWHALGGGRASDLDLARFCQQAENAYVGVACGLMDPFTSLHGRRGHALLLDCRSFDWRIVPLPANTAIVISDTRVRRELAASEFNLRRRQCEQAVAILRRTLPGVHTLRDVSRAELERLRGELPSLLFRRAQHVVEEIARVEEVIPDVERGDAAALGRAMTAAHRSGRELYEVSCRELDVLVESAVRIEGCYGARLTGAGFGGCTVSLVDIGCTDQFSAELSRAYLEGTGRTPEIWICAAENGASVTRVGPLPASRG